MEGKLSLELVNERGRFKNISIPGAPWTGRHRDTLLGRPGLGLSAFSSEGWRKDGVLRARAREGARKTDTLSFELEAKVLLEPGRNSRRPSVQRDQRKRPGLARKRGKNDRAMVTRLSNAFRVTSCKSCLFFTIYLTR